MFNIGSLQLVSRKLFIFDRDYIMDIFGVMQPDFSFSLPEYKYVFGFSTAQSHPYDNVHVWASVINQDTILSTSVPVYCTVLPVKLVSGIAKKLMLHRN